MSSAVDIYNQALLMIGENPIVNFDSTDDATNAQKVGAIMYGPIKEQVLRSYPWRSAYKQATLAQLADKPIDPQWDFAFAWPEDALRIVGLVSTTYPHREVITWEVQGRTILTRSQSSVVARYIYDVPEPQMDALLEEALAAKLAMDICYTFNASPERYGQLSNMFAAKLSEARTVDRQEGSHKTFRTDQLTAVR